MTLFNDRPKYYPQHAVKIIDVAREAKRIAEANPKFMYEPMWGHCGSCQAITAANTDCPDCGEYLSEDRAYEAHYFNRLTEQPECLFGQALSKLGIDSGTLKRMEYRALSEFWGGLSAFPDDSFERYWLERLNEIQEQQDAGIVWEHIAGFIDDVIGEAGLGQ